MLVATAAAAMRISQLAGQCAACLMVAVTALLAEEVFTDVVELDPFAVVAGEREALYAATVRSGRLLSAGGVGAHRSSQWLDSGRLFEVGASAIEDTFALIPGAYAPARFGVITAPNMRGDVAELYFNGQRRGDNLFGMPPGMAVVESMEVIAGVPMLRAGPGKRTGGAVNLLSRQAQLKSSAGSLFVRMGSWLPDGGSYLTLQAGFDQQVPVSEHVALRMVAVIQEDDTFYRANGGHDHQRDVMLSGLWQIAANQQLEWTLYYQKVARPQTLGVNRPWQGLIDTGLYLTGGVDARIGRQDPPGMFDPGVADPGLITAGPEALIRLPRDRVLMSRGDTGDGEAILFQGRYRSGSAGSVQFSQSVLVEAVERSKRNGFYYAEQVEQLTLDSLTLLSGRVGALAALEWETGLHVRYEERRNLTNYWNEFAYAFDISAARDFDAYRDFPEFIAFGGVVDGAGRPWYLPSDVFATPESTDSELLQSGVFGRVAWEILANWQLSAGARIDHFHVQASEPKVLTGDDRWRHSLSLWKQSGDVSLRWRAMAAHEFYLTVAHMSGIGGNTVGDGVNLYAPGRIHADDLRNQSRLYEIGGRHQLGAVFDAGWTLFAQERTRREFFGPMDIKARGIEARLDWQPRSGTRIYFNGSLLAARYQNAAPAEFGGGSLWNVYAPGAGPEAVGNGLGYIAGFFLNSMPPGDYRLPGVSRQQFSLGWQQRWDPRWRTHLWGTWQSRQTGNLAEEFVIPSQMEWHASITTMLLGGELQLLVRNLFDAENWQHNGDTFFNQMFISRALPRRVELMWRLAY